MAGIRHESERVRMINTFPTQKTINIAFVVAAMLVAVFSAQASSQSENLLLSAGFTAKAARTDSQREEVKTLAKGRVSEITQNGKTFYVYPDAQRDQLYVGDEAQYQIYLDSVTKAGGSDDAIVNTDDVRGNRVKVREFYGWEPFDVITP
jgi:hypothetical protein